MCNSKVSRWGRYNLYLEALNGLLFKNASIFFLIFAENATLPSLNIHKFNPSQPQSIKSQLSSWYHTRVSLLWVQIHLLLCKTVKTRLMQCNRGSGVNCTIFLFSYLSHWFSCLSIHATLTSRLKHHISKYQFFSCRWSVSKTRICIRQWRKYFL